ncbi:MAG TPA: TVP38/TMEM64 family protein [Thermoanaerobaculia bacterium]|nr:TVP38/TMEM64 family protein [Thermoanaerobaculia bacterium]
MNASTEPGAPAAKSKSKTLLLIVVALAVIVGLALGGKQLSGAVLRFAEWVQSLGAWGPLVFILGYVAATVAFAPAFLLTLAAGVIFGLVKGALYTFIGATVGASLAFLIARYGARRAIEKKIAGNPKFAAIDRAVSKEGLKIVSLLRLSPVFPFNLLNYALGLTKVRFLDYLLGCFAMIPGTILYVYYGTAAGSLAEVASGKAGGQGATKWISLGIGILATIIVSTFITRLASKALKTQLGEPSTPGKPGAPEEKARS